MGKAGSILQACSRLQKVVRLHRIWSILRSMWAAVVLSFYGIQFMCTQWLKYGTPGASVSLPKRDLQSARRQYYVFCCLLNRKLRSNYCWSFTKAGVGGLNFQFLVCWVFPALRPEYLDNTQEILLFQEKKRVLAISFLTNSSCQKTQQQNQTKIKVFSKCQMYCSY